MSLVDTQNLSSSGSLAVLPLNPAAKFSLLQVVQVAICREWIQSSWVVSPNVA